MKYRLLSLIAPVALLLTLVLVSTLTRNVSDSAAPLGWYHVHWGATARAGDLVLLRMPIKQVWALPGQQVTFAKDGVYVDGRHLPNSAPEPGIPLVCPLGKYVVPPYFFLAMGTNNPDSYDGRYECFTPLSLIAATVTPVWTKK